MSIHSIFVIIAVIGCLSTIADAKDYLYQDHCTIQDECYYGYCDMREQRCICTNGFEYPNCRTRRPTQLMAFSVCMIGCTFGLHHYYFNDMKNFGVQFAFFIIAGGASFGIYVFFRSHLGFITGGALFSLYQFIMLFLILNNRNEGGIPDLVPF